MLSPLKCHDGWRLHSGCLGCEEGMVQQWLCVVAQHGLMAGCGVVVAVHSVARQGLFMALTKFVLIQGRC